MNLKDINYYLPLNNIELTYKDIFFNNPNFEFDKPKIPKTIDSFLEKLNLDVSKLKDPIKISSKKEISLKQLSIKFNYSERQMARILKEYTGKTFINIIQDIKLQNACALLKNPDISINKIIDSVGYSNSTHFYKIFKKSYGVTPIDYRNSNINFN